MTVKRRRTRLFRGVAAILAVAAGVSFATPAIAAIDPTATDRPAGQQVDTQSTRGTVLSVTMLRKLSRAQVIAELSEAGYDPGTVKYGVTLYRLRYRTIDERGRVTTASGLLVLPRNPVRHA
jgi:hypothetical protein